MQEKNEERDKTERKRERQIDSLTNRKIVIDRYKKIEKKKE